MNVALDLVCSCADCVCHSFLVSSDNNATSRKCLNCQHDFIAHAVHRCNVRLPPGTPQVLGSTSSLLMLPPETPDYITSLRVASLFLYRTQAIPIRAKILMQKMCNGLKCEEMEDILYKFGWDRQTLEKGYKEKDGFGACLYSWSTVSGCEELIALQQFMRFDSTRPTVTVMLQDSIAEANCIQNNIETDGHLQPSLDTFINSIAHPAPILNSGPLVPTHTRPVLSPPLVLNTCYSSTLFSLVSPASAPGDSMTRSMSYSPRRCKSVDTVQDAVQDSNSCTSLSPSLEDVPQDLSTKQRTNLNMSRPCMYSSKTIRRIRASALQYSSPLLYRKRVWTEDNDFGLSEPGEIPMNSMHEIDWTAILAKKARIFKGIGGKKRVRCNTCFKTYCDKGALKIHYGAVHLKQKHLCTIPGCPRVFSSRRSRNRHSGNANMKLHMPGALDARDVTTLEEDACIDSQDCDSSSDSGCSQPIAGDKAKRKRKNDQPIKILHSAVKNLNGHEEIGIDDIVKADNYSCGICGVGFMSAVQVEDHYKNDHNNKTVKEEQLLHTTETPLDLCSRSVAGGSNSMLDEEVSPSDSPGSQGPSYSSTQICSPHNSNTSEGHRVFTKNIVMVRCKTPEGSPIEIPMDEDNPKRCTWCGNILQNHFSVKTHYLNVHLKLLHKCFIAGCTAAFPSKRSRDRHSINKKLHDKKMSIPSREIQVNAPPNVTISGQRNSHSLESSGKISPLAPVPGNDMTPEVLLKYQQASMLAAQSLLMASRYRSGAGAPFPFPYLVAMQNSFAAALHQNETRDCNMFNNNNIKNEEDVK